MQHQEGADQRTKKKGDSNDGHNKNRNVHHAYRSINCYTTKKFKRKVKGMSTLGVKVDKHTDSFMVFQKELHAYALVNYKYPSDISSLAMELKGPLPCLMNQIPTIDKLKKEWGIDPQISGTELTEDENIIVNNLQELLGPERICFC